MKLRNLITALTAALLPLTATALTEKNVTGEYTFYGDGSPWKGHAWRQSVRPSAQ